MATGKTSTRTLPTVPQVKRRRGRRVVHTREARFRRYDLEGPLQREMALLPLSYERPRGVGAYLLRMQPGAVTIAHDHRFAEEFMLLEGYLVDDDGSVFGPGDWVRYEQGSHHHSWTDDGCLLLVFEWPDPPR